MSPPPAEEPGSNTDNLGLEAFRAPADDTGLSLNQLSAAFAEMLNSGSDPYEQSAAAESAETDAALGDMPVDGGAEPDDGCEISPRSILEAMLFVGGPQNEPLTSQQVARLMRGVRPAEIDVLVRELNGQYRARNCPYQIVSEGAGYRLVLREQFGGVRSQFYGKARQARLSQAAIEVLAAVAYHEPLTGEEVAKLRGTASAAILSQLVRRQLLRLDRSDKQFRGGRYYTTSRFLELFGLQSLEDLPRSQELEEQ